MAERISPPLEIDAEMELSNARLQLVRIHHVGPSVNMFARDGVY